MHELQKMLVIVTELNSRTAKFELLCDNCHSCKGDNYPSPSPSADASGSASPNASPEASPKVSACASPSASACASGSLQEEESKDVEENRSGLFIFSFGEFDATKCYITATQREAPGLLTLQESCDLYLQQRFCLCSSRFIVIQSL